jgi:hypothetical protein
MDDGDWCLTTRVSRRTCHLQVSFKFHHSKQQPPPWEWTAWAARRPLPVLPPAEVEKLHVKIAAMALSDRDAQDVAARSPDAGTCA